MIARLLAGVAASTLLAVSVVIGSASGAQAAGTCEGWRDKGLPPDYCKIKPEQAHVYAQFTNNSDRQLHFWVFSGDNRNWEREFTVAPGRTATMWGGANSGIDLRAYVSWCPTVAFSATCPDKVRTELTWKNPLPWGWPWMRVSHQEHGFRALERHTFEEAYGPAGVKGVAKFKTVRLTDMSSGTKRFEVGFTLAPAATS